MIIFFLRFVTSFFI